MHFTFTGRPLHGECFNCETCKCTLKNVGHFAIGEKLYCQLHAKEAQNAIHGNFNSEAKIIKTFYVRCLPWFLDFISIL